MSSTKTENTKSSLTQWIYLSWGKAHYEVVVKNDTTWLITTYKRAYVNMHWVRNFKLRRIIWLNGDYITRALYKKGPGINNHIDEYSILVKKTDNPKKVELNWPRISYIFPDGFKGAAWIAFNQPDGIPPAYDSLGNPILKIPANGLLQTTLHEDIFATANEYYKIMEESSKGKGYKRYQSYDKFASIDSTCCNPDSLIAFMCGFNQKPRNDINENIFHKPIYGNVMTIYIGKYKWFEKNWWLHPWDSKME
ncbi:MAG: hypothetical protein AB9846_03640 [Tenuifilaceae bacterium]